MDLVALIQNGMELTVPLHDAKVQLDVTFIMIWSDKKVLEELTIICPVVGTMVNKLP